MRSQAAEEAIRRMAEAEDTYEKALPEIKRLTSELAAAEAKLKVCRIHPDTHTLKNTGWQNGKQAAAWMGIGNTSVVP